MEWSIFSSTHSYPEDQIELRGYVHVQNALSAAEQIHAHHAGGCLGQSRCVDKLEEKISLAYVAHGTTVVQLSEL
jgi:hypothetical protein